MKITKDEIIRLYYVEELPLKEIASMFGCTEENVRRLRSNRFHLPSRDREWLSGEIEAVAEEMIRQCSTGNSLEHDMRTMASMLHRRTSDVRLHLSPYWLSIYAPNVDAVAKYPVELNMPTIRFSKMGRDVRSPVITNGLELITSDSLDFNTGEVTVFHTKLSIAIPDGFYCLPQLIYLEAAKKCIIISSITGIQSPQILTKEAVDIIMIKLGGLPDVYNIPAGEKIVRLLFTPAMKFSIQEVAYKER